MQWGSRRIANLEFDCSHKHTQTQPCVVMGKSRAGRSLSGAQEGQAQVGTLRSQASEGVCIERALSTLGFFNVDCVAGCVCANMHNEPSKARAGGLYVNHPGYGPVRQAGTRCASGLSIASSRDPKNAHMRSTDPPQALAARALVRASR